MWPLIGIVIVILGFALRFNPLVVVTLAGLITGLTIGLDLPEVISDFGTGLCAKSLYGANLTGAAGHRTARAGAAPGNTHPLCVAVAHPDFLYADAEVNRRAGPGHYRRVLRSADDVARDARQRDERRGLRLLDAIGWDSVSPQMLAALGGIFALAGVGKLVAGLITDVIPPGLPIVAVAAYCIGMALFTIIMGNAFAAFPIITACIGLLIIVGHMGYGWQPGHHVRHRHAGGVLRHVNDPHGGQF